MLVLFSPFMFPLYLVRFSVLGIPFTVMEIYTYIVVLVFLINLISKNTSLHFEKPLKSVYLWGILLFIGATIGTAQAPTEFLLPSGELQSAQQVSLGVLKGWVLAPLLYFGVLTQVIQDRNKLQHFISSVLYAGGVVSLAALLWTLTGQGWTWDGRLAGFFESANYLSLFLLPLLLLGIHRLFERKKWGQLTAIFSSLSLALMLITLVLTQSYAAIVGLFGAMGLYSFVYLLRDPRHRKKAGWGLLGLMLVFVLAVATQWKTEKFQQFIDFENRSSTTVRLEIYRVSGHLIAQHPIVGIGPGLFQSYYQNQAPEVLERAPLEWNMPHPHNIFLAFWLNAGLLGIIALLGLLIRAHRRFTWPLLALWGLLIHGLFDTPFWKNDLAMIFWVVMGVVILEQLFSTSND